MSEQTSDDAEQGRLEFRIGDAFPGDDPVARLFLRLSMALGDLRVALEYAVRDEQPPYERLYFVRLTAMHLRELLSLLDPPPGSTWPSVEALIAATQPRAEDAARLRAAHARMLEFLAEPFEQRPTVTLKGELRRLRNGFAHYHRDARSEAALTAAMEARRGR